MRRRAKQANRQGLAARLLLFLPGMTTVNYLTGPDHPYHGTRRIVLSRERNCRARITASPILTPVEATLRSCIDYPITMCRTTVTLPSIQRCLPSRRQTRGKHRLPHSREAASDPWPTSNDCKYFSVVRNKKSNSKEPVNDHKVMERSAAQESSVEEDDYDDLAVKPACSRRPRATRRMSHSRADVIQQ